METVTLHLNGLEELKKQISELASKIDDLQNIKLSKEWVKNAQASEFLGVTSRTLQKYRDEGIISYSKIGSLIYYKQSDLDNHLKSHYHSGFNKGRRND